MLEEVPCGDKFPTCKFLHDAYEALEKVPQSEKKLVTLGTQKESLSGKIKELDSGGVEKHIQKYNLALEKKKTIEHAITTIQIGIEKNNSQSAHSELLIQDLNRKKDAYEENKEAIENFELLTIEKENFDAAILIEQEKLETCQKEVMELYKTHGSLSQKVQNLEEQKKERQTLREEYTAYDLFMRCMHSNGIAYDIIKK